MLPALTDILLENLPANGYSEVDVRQVPVPPGAWAYDACEVAVGGRMYRVDLDEAPYSYEWVVTHGDERVGSTFPRSAGDSESRGVLRLILDDLRREP